MSHDLLFSANKKTWVTANAACYPYYCTVPLVSKPKKTRGRPPRTASRKKMSTTGNANDKKNAQYKKKSNNKQSQSDSMARTKQNETNDVNETKISPVENSEVIKQQKLDSDSDFEPFTIIADAELDQIDESSKPQAEQYDIRNEFEPSQTKKVKLSIEEPANQLTKVEEDTLLPQKVENNVVTNTNTTQPEKLALDDCYFEVGSQEELDALHSDFSEEEEEADDLKSNQSKLKIENSVFDESTRLNMEESSTTKLEFV